MTGTIDRDGTVTITFNLQADRLDAPSLTGERRQWLPCEDCGRLLSVAYNVCSVVCPACWCDACQAPARLCDGEPHGLLRPAAGA